MNANRWWVACALAGSMQFGPGARAQVPEEGDGALLTEEAAPTDWPTRRSERPLVMPRGMVRAGATVGVHRFGFGGGSGVTGGTISIGGGVTVVDNLEVGIEGRREWTGPNAYGGLLGLRFVGNGGGVDMGDIPFYARYQFVDAGSVQVAGDLVLYAPLDGRFHSDLSVPVRVHFTDGVALDTGATVSVSANPGDVLLHVPVIVRASIGNGGYLAGATGVTTDFDYTAIPIGAEGGVSLAVGSGVLDLEAGVGFPYLFAFAGGQSEVFSGVWQLSFAARYHIGVF